jgi:hypothetical protein
MVGNPTALVDRWFRDADGEVAIEVAGIRVDHLAVVPEGKVNGGVRLSDAGWAEDGNDKRMLIAGHRNPLLVLRAYGK